jgi:cephalosporin-C deacetylase
MSAPIEQFQARLEQPADFDAFWEATIAELGGTPPRPTVEPDALRSTERVSVAQIHVDSYGGVRLFGWFARPAAPGRHPGLLMLPGYSANTMPQRALAGEGFAVLALSVRGHNRSNGQYAPGFPGLMVDGIERKESYGYRGVYMDCWRGLDALLALEGVDPGRLGVTGGSQGGALTLLTAALRPEISAAAADVPFLCAIRDAVDLTTSYPFAEIGDLLRQRPELAEAVWRTIPYYDILNFAPRIACPTLVSLGLRDDVCPPQTGYALYNALTCPKELRTYPNAAHEGGGFSHGQVKLAWLKERLGLGVGVGG